MRILVTGGAGFIGSHVAERFLAHGHTVAVLDNFSTGFRRNVPPAAQVYEGDIRDADFVRGVYDDFRPEVVDHHAAQMDVRKSLLDPVFDAQTNIIGSINLILEAVNHKVKRFVYVSTGGAVYGEPQYLPVDENHPLKPECAYGISKHTVEHYLELYRILYDLNYVVLRYANVYGPRQNPHGEAGVNAIFIGQMLQGRTPTIFGGGEQLRDYVYIADIADANLRALTHGTGGIHNIGTGVGTSVNQIYRTLCTILEIDREPVYAPAREGEIERIILSADKARRVLGWEPVVGFEEGLRRTVEWAMRERTVETA